MSNVFAWLAQSGVVQGIIIGATLAFLTAILVMDLVARSITTTADGWSSIRRCGRPENGILVRAACAKALPLVNVLEEAAYWTTARDGSGRRLSGMHEYVLHFPAGQLPPNHAFWSLTTTDAVGYMVANPTGRHSVGTRSELARNADGSTDVYAGTTPPIGREDNWLPTPAGEFALMLRAYLPGEAILEGTYRVPEVREVHGR